MTHQPTPPAIPTTSAPTTSANHRSSSRVRQRVTSNKRAARSIAVSAAAAVALSLLAGCTTPNAGAGTSVPPAASVPAGSDGTLSTGVTKTGFNVNDNKTEVVMTLTAVSATLTPTGDSTWDLTMRGVGDTLARNGAGDSAQVAVTTFFDNPSTLTVRLGTANGVLSGDIAGEGQSSLVLAVGSPALTADGDATFEASSIQTGELSRRLARTGGVTITSDNHTSKDVSLLPVDAAEPITMNEVELHLSVAGAHVINGCALLPGANCTGADLFQANIVDADLAGIDLSKANLAMSTLHESDFTGANLTSAQIFRSDLTNSILVDATLDGAALEQSTFKNADLSGASARRVNLFRSEMSGVRFTAGNLADANLAQVIASLTHADLTGADLRNSDLSGADLSFANLAGANLTGVNFTGANLTGTVMWLADINGASFNGAVFSRTTRPDGSVTQETNRGTAKRPQVVQFCTPIYLPGVASGQPAGPRPAEPRS